MRILGTDSGDPKLTAIPADWGHAANLVGDFIQDAVPGSCASKDGLEGYLCTDRKPTLNTAIIVSRADARSEDLHSPPETSSSSVSISAVKS